MKGSSWMINLSQKEVRTLKEEYLNSKIKDFIKKYGVGVSFCYSFFGAKRTRGISKYETTTYNALYEKINAKRLEKGIKIYSSNLLPGYSLKDRL